MIKSKSGTQYVLDGCKALIVALDAFFLLKGEQGVQCLQHILIKSVTIATLTEVLLMTNSVQKFLHSSRPDFLQIPREVEKLIQKLKSKYNKPLLPETLYYIKLKSFLEITSRSAIERYNSHSNQEFVGKKMWEVH